MTMPQAADSSTSGPRTFWIGVALAVVVAGGLRVWGLNAESLDIDEVYEIRHQSVSISELANRQDSFPPLGRWLLGIWLAVGGDASARWFSLVTGLLGVVAIGLLGRCVGGDRIGVLAAWLAAISANHLLYSQQARLYGLYLLFATALMIAAWRLRTRDRWSDWLWFAVAAWLTLATHYYAALLIALLFVLLFAELSWPNRRRAMVAAGMFAIACLPLAYCLKVDLGRTKYDYLTASFDFSAWAYTYLTLVSGFTLGPPMSALRELSAADGIRALAPWAIAICLAVGVLAWSCIQRLAWRDSLWLFTLLIAPPAMAAAAAVVSPTGYTSRYLVWILAPLLVIMAAGMDRWRGRPVVLIAAIGFVAISLLAIGNRRLDPDYRVYHFDHVKQLMIEEGPADPVLALPRYFAEAAEYHLAVDTGTQTRPVFLATDKPGEEQNWDEVLPQLLAAIGESSEYWIVTQSFPPDDARRDLRDELVDRLAGKYIERVTWTIDVYRAPTARLRQVVASIDETPDE